MNQIVIKNARENNLKGVDLTIPRNKVVCFVGVSGSGKSTIVISQDRVRGNPRSTVGTLTEAYTYLRLLYSRVGLPSMDSTYYSFNHPYGFCKKCKGLGRSVEVNINKILDFDKSLNEGALIPKEWYIGGRQWSIIKASHYFDMDKKLSNYGKEDLDKLLNAPPEMLEAHSGELVDRFTFQGMVYRIMHRNTKVHRGPSESDMKYFDFVDCPQCYGGRLNEKALSVKLNGFNIGEVGNMPLTECLEFVKSIKHVNATPIKPRLLNQLQSLIEVGVGYLSLNRSSDTLSGGEAQRVKMARQIDCDLIETIYVLDEPTAGLHPKDVSRVLENLRKLKNNDNTVIVVEHDETVIRNSDYLIEIGPGGGKMGGEIVSVGKVEDLESNPSSLTGKYLSGEKGIVAKKSYRKPSGKLLIENAKRHNLKNLTVGIPKGVLVVLTGVSGSGKSSLVEEIVSQHSDDVVLIDQGAVGANKRGCIATYVGAFDIVRNYYAKEFRMHPSFFSYNSHGGCELCRGIGFVEMDMNFLGDVRIKCESCKGMRYKEKVLRYKYNGKNIAEVLSLTAKEAHDFFDDLRIKEQMDLLTEVGLDYMEIGQTLDTLSGGESQRLKLASRLQAKGEFYILDEPTSGLHFADVEKLLILLNRLVDNGNTVLVVEHNLNVIKNADWIIDLGPEGGEKGGEVVGVGIPKEIVNIDQSYTGKFLQNV